MVARPRSRYWHDYRGCGWHYSQFALESGRILYRYRVNLLLGQSDLGLQLAEDGEDRGRLVTVTDDSRTALAGAIAQRSGPDDSNDRARYALALFRARNATEHDKRSAVVTLAGLLGERRGLLKSHLLRKDEGRSSR